jgi:SAM-dependent methyltransferase
VSWSQDVFQWDVRSWSRALPLWRGQLRHPPGSPALAIGERDGGLSVLLAQSGYRTWCTDVDPPRESARALHRAHGLEALVTYDVQDATALGYADGTFDVVAFKSVIGALGSKDRQRSAVLEMLRVLRPGGVLLFAENLEATRLHRRLRRRFVRWDRNWRYLSVTADRDLLDGFERVDARTCGLLANLGRSERHRGLLARLDTVLAPLVPSSWHYIVYGVAFKPV